jgi:transposase
MIGQRTQLSNMIRGLIGEFGCIVAKGLNHIRLFAEAMKTSDAPLLPAAAGDVIASLCEQLLALHRRIGVLEKKIFAASRKDARVRLLETIPGIGPVTASGRLRPRRLSRRLEHPISSGPGARLPPGSALPHSTDRAGARNALADIEDGRPVSASVARRRHDIQSARGARTS